MDYHNNAIGRQIALDLGKHASDEELMKACYNYEGYMVLIIDPTSELDKR